MSLVLFKLSAFFARENRSIQCMSARTRLDYAVTTGVAQTDLDTFYIKCERLKTSRIDT